METSVDDIEYEVRNRFRFDHMSFCRTAVRRGRDGQTLKKVLTKLASAHPRLKRYQRNRGNRECLGAAWHLLPLPPLEHSWLSPVAREEGNRLHEALTGHVGADLDGRIVIDNSISITANCRGVSEALAEAVKRGVLISLNGLRYVESLSENLIRSTPMCVSIILDRSVDLPYRIRVSANTNISLRDNANPQRASQQLIEWWTARIDHAFGQSVESYARPHLQSNRYDIEFERTQDGAFFANGSVLGCQYETLDKCLEVVEKLLSDGVEPPQHADCSVLTDEALYHRVRDAMAPFDMSWITQFVLGYNGRAPDFWKLPEGFSEYRFPLAQWHAPFEAIVLQVDVVHSEEGSFLEFQSVCDREDFLKLLEPAADLIGDLEWWDGPPQHRWDR